MENLAELRITEMSFPTKVVFGVGALSRLPSQVQRLKMTNPLVVSDPGVAKAGLVARATDVLKRAGISHRIFDRVRLDPTEQDAFEGLEAYREGNCDGVIAIGGGSPLDAAKLIQLLATHEPPLSRYDDATGGDRFVRDDMPPLIAIPTTAGTGSEVSRSGVATLKDTGRKTVIFSPYLMPKAAICDPQLTVGLPPGPTAATGMDAFTHCLEAYVATGFHPLADALALDGIGPGGASAGHRGQGRRQARSAQRDDGGGDGGGDGLPEGPRGLPRARPRADPDFANPPWTGERDRAADGDGVQSRRLHRPARPGGDRDGGQPAGAPGIARRESGRRRPQAERRNRNSTSPSRCGSAGSGSSPDRRQGLRGRVAPDEPTEDLLGMLRAAY